MSVEQPVTQVLVPGRGHQAQPDGSLVLTPSAIARVETAVAYYEENAGAFDELGGQVDFEGGWAKAASGIDKPPESLREGALMAALAREQGMPSKYVRQGIESTSTMTNCLDARHYFAGAGRLAIVTQLSQADRFRYCAGKVFPRTEITIVEAPGESDPSIIADEQRLLKQSKLLYGWAWGPRTLSFADSMGTFAGGLAGLKPGAKYGAVH